MKELRELIQSRLNTIEGIESGPPIPDDVIENGKTYFGYELQLFYQDSDTDSNYTMQVFINGRLVRKNIPTENTLEILDEATASVFGVLKALNFSYNSQDISSEDSIKKILINGNAIYNEINIKKEV